MIPRLSAVTGIRTAWLIAMFAVLISWMAATMSSSPSASQASQDGEWHLLVVLILVALTFPMGIIWASLLNVGAYLLDAFNYSAEFYNALLIPFVWLGFVAVGYVQWFKLLPWLCHEWKKRESKRPKQNGQRGRNK